jgi:hypothetical protein
MLSFGSPQQDASICQKPAAPTSIRVDVNIDSPDVNHSTSRASLKQFEIATVSPYGNGTNVHVNGLMRGAITLDTQFSLAWQKNTDESVNCSWYDHVNLTLKLKPVIYVASEIPNDSCMYREVLNHEYKHYQTDYNISKDYQVIFQDELQNFLQQADVIGPYGKDDQEKVKIELTKRLDKVISAVNDRMKVERIKRQSMIDSREEYERVAHACGDAVGTM